MSAFEIILIKEEPDLVVVVGDVNSTLACALTAAKLDIKVAHVEAGLRSFDKRMPEEINRVLTDSISDFLFITEKSAEKNLLAEGVSKKRIFFVGNVMIDTLLNNKKKADASNILVNENLISKKYALLTLHRPENVDEKDKLKDVLDAIDEISKHIQIIFPVHPRTTKKLAELGIRTNGCLKLIEPLGYLDFLKLMNEAKFVLTDSGGIQEETTILKIPCLTLRKNTERPVTIKEGTNRLVGNDKKKIVDAALKILEGRPIKGQTPRLWDGQAAKRIVNILRENFI